MTKVTYAPAEKVAKVDLSEEDYSAFMAKHLPAMLENAIRLEKEHLGPAGKKSMFEDLTEQFINSNLRKLFYQYDKSHLPKVTLAKGKLFMLSREHSVSGLLHVIAIPAIGLPVGPPSYDTGTSIYPLHTRRDTRSAFFDIAESEVAANALKEMAKGGFSENKIPWTWNSTGGASRIDLIPSNVKNVSYVSWQECDPSDNRKALQALGLPSDAHSEIARWELAIEYTDRADSSASSKVSTKRLRLEVWFVLGMTRAHMEMSQAVKSDPSAGEAGEMQGQELWNGHLPTPEWL
ncbi:hypothetical protein JCM10908_002219 [Rhodotorula pacifica]|uniref:uncharacterized protein n=1 Tax=Rhodotorula pacifica TaxID=1495444 RepID=UPI0031815519